MKWDICLFSAFSTYNFIPDFTKCYLLELQKYIQEVFFITTQDLDNNSLSFLKTYNISYIKVQNEGYDFGMFYKNLSLLEGKKTMVLANDSVVLVNDFNIVFETINKNKWDFAGITDHCAYFYHFQSYFWFFNKQVFPIIKQYFKKYGILKSKQNVVKKYEAELSHQLIQNTNYSCGCVFPLKDYLKLEDIRYIKEVNGVYLHIEEYLLKGLPVIKRNLLFTNPKQTEKYYLADMENNISFSIRNDILEEAITKCKEKNVFDFKNKKIIVIIHLYYEYMWWRLRKKIKILYNNFNTDIYLSLCRGSKMTPIIKKEFPSIKIKIVENKGGDVGAFLQIIKEITEDYNYMLKIHTKKSSSVPSHSNRWRQELIYSLIGSKKQIERCLFCMEDYRVGMIGDEISIGKFNTNELYKNKTDMNELEKELKELVEQIGINITRDKNYYCMIGDMFWIKYPFIKKTISSNIINTVLEKMKNENRYKMVEKTKDSIKFYPVKYRIGEHSVERLFGIITYLKYNSTLFGINPFDGC